MNGDNDKDGIIPNSTCHGEHERYEIKCEKKSCKYWHDLPDSQNCIMIAARNGEHTLQQIGDIFGVTRMRICQIEKIIFKKLLKRSDIHSTVD
ncbi:MAG: hypothetical protein CME70_18665 [Halobacteriovorax sp.]|nr:hypothetical protein [Halobacteriovorax sp.]|tara:strand:- start:1268 stop:1546 length:279 start_codon:yes stop_codon:yes gene_type:complete